MEKLISKIAFYGSPYEYSLFLEGSQELEAEIFRIEENPLETPCDLLVWGHMLPDFDSAGIVRSTNSGPDNVAVISHGPYPLSGAPCPVDPTSDTYNFQWLSDTTLAKYIVRLVEDQQNADFWYNTMHKRLIILLEDEINYASYIIPLIIDELERRTLSLMPSQSACTRLDKIHRERPILLVAANYDQVVKYLNLYSDRTVGIISSLGFPMAGKNNLDAGFALIDYVKGLQWDIPVVIISSQQDKKQEIVRRNAAFLHKNSPDLLSHLRNEMLDYFGFGDFIFRMPGDSKSEVARARNLKELHECLSWIPLPSFIYHAQKRHFSNWLGVHGYLEAAESIRPIPAEQGEQARTELVNILKSLCS
ncbi:hypothetical protein KKF34_06555 [Myxococcota bacterium]|nr:hypothetical protein [Myxococcota bacterium]MBU1381677.1 hypothetical protein [Myxococcota bacterium]MBU1496520.1 hypothetical protein [Myxococcota bacterium]